MTKLTVFGSARIDAFFELSDVLGKEVCDIDTKRCFIQLSYAAKLPLKSATYLVGGNGANVSVGTKRLGVESTLVAELGEGIMSDYAVKELAKEIDTSYISQTKGVKEGFGGVIVYHGERTILSYYPPDEPPFPKDLPPSEWVYLTSVGESFEKFFGRVFEWLSGKVTKLVFNPSGRQVEKGKDWLGKYLKVTEALFINREEAEKIVGMDKTYNKEKDLLDAASSLGPKIVVMTDGGGGSYAKEGDKYYKVGVLPVDSIERTGAGDAFSTGCMGALMKGKDLSEALLWGTANSASVIGYIGSQRGLLKEDEMSSWIERAKSSNVKVEEF